MDLLPLLFALALVIIVVVIYDNGNRHRRIFVGADLDVGRCQLTGLENLNAQEKHQQLQNGGSFYLHDYVTCCWPNQILSNLVLYYWAPTCKLGSGEPFVEALE